MATDLTQEFCALRDTYIEKQFGRLNDMQRQAVFTTDGPLLILAGAGSGKTTVLVNRIANLIRFGSAHGSKQTPRPATEDDIKALRNAIMTGTAAPSWLDGMLRQNAVRSWNVMAIPVTNKAAGELKERLRRMLGGEEGDEVFASTFHSACVRILRRWAEEIGYPRSFTIYDTDDSQRVMKAVYKDLNVDDKFLPIKAAINQMSRWKDQLVSPEQALASPAKDTKGALTARIYAAYEKRLKEAGAFDFDDLIYQTVQLLAEHKDVRDFYQNKYRYLLVDEYQDTSVAQFRLVSLLTGPERNICVVGDDDQSIYGWRGAQISNILEFERFFPNPSVIKLEENYRCTAPILDTANALIHHNLGRRDKTLRAHKGGGEAVRLISMPGDAEEAEFIITDIENVRRQEGRPWEDFAILFRANTQSRIIEQTLREHKIPYRMVGAQSFFDRKEVKDLISYLATIENPQADEYLLRILNTPPRGSSELTSHLASDWSREHGYSGCAALQDEVFLAALSTRARNSVQAFNELIAKYIDLFQDKETDFGDILEQLIEETGFSEYVTRLCKTEAEIQKRLVSIGDVKASLRNFWQPGKPLRDYLAKVTLDK